jgi:Brp/Blh family beta-carotene 15,15'-monooxygenase
MPGVVDELRYVPLIASLVVLGLPHGAVDHLIPNWVAGRPLGRRPQLLLIGGYVAVTGAGIALWLWSPLAGLAVFFAVTVGHWGASELAWFPTARRRTAFAAARGLVPVGLPALAFPRAFGQAISALLSPFMANPPVVTPTGWVRVGGLVALALICLAGSGQGVRERLELIGLIVFFAVVQPVFAVGLYFIAWHSWRHIVRLATLEPGARRQMRAGRPGRAVARVMVAAGPCTAVALAGLGGFAALLAIQPSSGAQITAAALALIAGLTVPHTLVVAWLDGARVSVAQPALHLRLG